MTYADCAVEEKVGDEVFVGFAPTFAGEGKRTYRWVL